MLSGHLSYSIPGSIWVSTSYTGCGLQILVILPWMAGDYQYTILCLSYTSLFPFFSCLVYVYFGNYIDLVLIALHHIADNRSSLVVPVGLSALGNLKGSIGGPCHDHKAVVEHRLEILQTIFVILPALA